jgi:H+/gluconate symporter-like permease
MGTAVVFGMTVATVIGVFIIPACYAFVMRLSSRKKKPSKEQQDQEKPAPSNPPEPA